MQALGRYLCCYDKTKNDFVVVIAILALIGGTFAVLATLTNREVTSEIEVLNPEGDKGRALVVYHPSLSDFQTKVIFAFAKGLASSGWLVDVTTASRQAPRKAQSTSKQQSTNWLTGDGTMETRNPLSHHSIHSAAQVLWTLHHGSLTENGRTVQGTLRNGLENSR